MTEDTDAQALGMRPADDPAGARAGVPGPAAGLEHVDVVTLRDGIVDDLATVYGWHAATRALISASLDTLIAAVRADATRTAEAEVAGLRKHPHDGYAYDGCVCVCCLNVRALAIAAQPAAPEPPVCTCYPGTDEHDYSCPTAWAARNPRPPEPDRTEALVEAWREYLPATREEFIEQLTDRGYDNLLALLNALAAPEPAPVADGTQYPPEAA